MIVPASKQIRALVTARIVFLVFASAIVLIVASSCISEDDLTIDQRAHQLSQQLMCPVCDGQSLDQSQAQISEDMKAVIREKLEAGESNEDIRSYFVERYGELVLAAPATSGFNLVAWAMPLLIFLAGVLVVINAMRRMRSQPDLVSANATSPNDTDDKETGPEDLSEYLELVDERISSIIDNPSNPSDESRAQ